MATSVTGQQDLLIKPVPIPPAESNTEAVDDAPAAFTPSSGQVSLILLLAIIVAGFIYWAVKKFIPYK